MVVCVLKPTHTLGFLVLIYKPSEVKSVASVTLVPTHLEHLLVIELREDSACDLAGFILNSVEKNAVSMISVQLSGGPYL